MDKFLYKIKKNVAKFISLFIKSSNARKEFRHKFMLPISMSDYYGKIYMPYYPNEKFSCELPQIYNSEGRKMELFFLRDRIGSHCSYSDSSKYFLWDRFNIGLDVHFYTHGTILETMGKPKQKYGIFVESESIIPNEYALFKTHKGIEKDFDAIFTYSEDLLSSLDNAVFFPACSSMWYGKEYYNGVKDSTKLNSEVYKSKNKNISMVCSAKKMTEMHKIRHKIANEALKAGVDVFGGFNNGIMFDYKSRTLKDYRFQIVVENDIKPYYFTEKIIDCFAAMTIPIYIGATKIDEFFNSDGIIKISKDENIEKIVQRCTEQEYNNRINAVIDNYNRCLKYQNLDNLLYESYFLNKTS